MYVYKNTLFYITFDENGGNTFTRMFKKNQIYGLLLGAGVPTDLIGRPQPNELEQYNHYSWLATVEKIFKVGNLSRKDKSATTYDFLNYE